MVSIKWCKEQKHGIELTEPNKNMSKSYINMAEESIKVLKGITDSNIWTATTSYYIFYYSLYALLLRIGIKCEIHACSIKCMKEHLSNQYNLKDQEMIEKAFQARIDLQYYTDRPVDERIISEVRLYCKEFFIKTKDILTTIDDNTIKQIRQQVESA